MVETAFIAPWALIMSLVFSGGMAPLPPGVPPLEEDPALMRVIPEGTLLFVEWFGVGDADPKSTNATERLAAEPEIQALIESVETALRAAARAESPRGAGGGAGPRHDRAHATRMCLRLGGDSSSGADWSLRWTRRERRRQGLGHGPGGAGD